MDRPTRLDRGFTLVELMVAVALLGMIMTVIFALFASTSDSLYEADSLADTINRARFGVERVSGDLRSAGSFASPDSQEDPWVQPKVIGPNSRLRVYGVSSYDGWQNDDSILSSELQSAHAMPSSLEENDKAGTYEATDSGSAISFDGFIVMGAVDYPQSFEIAEVHFNGEGDADGGWIPGTERSLFKLLANDPFYTRVGQPAGTTLDSDSDKGDDEIITRDMQNRLLRVMDRSGYVQMSGIDFSTLPEYAENSGPGGGGIEFKLRIPMAVQESEASGAVEFGLERDTTDDEDIGYDAAMIDAFWYHVEVDPEDPVNFRLVRERLDAHALAQALRAGPATIGRDALTDTLAAKAHSTGGETAREKVVITDRVVDFQVWFDCADDNGNLTGRPWQLRWANPAGDSGGGCMDPSAPEFGRARIGHVRLSVRTANERQDAPDSYDPSNGTYDSDAFFMDEEGKPNATVPLRYFDMHPDAKGSARVVTVQTDVELANFAARNL
ncbi:MAG: PilW family protein [Persicimonas sp.]